MPMDLVRKLSSYTSSAPHPARWLEIEAKPSDGACLRMAVPATAEGTSPLENDQAHRVEIQLRRSGKSTCEHQVVRLLVADDHPAVRAGFVALLNRQPEFDVIGEAAYGEEAVRLAETLEPDAIIMDVDMPVVDGIEATRRIKERQPGIVIVALSLHEGDAIERAMAEAGADSYISKHASAKSVVDAVRQACCPPRAT